MSAKPSKKQSWPYVTPWVYADGTQVYSVDARTKAGGGRKFFPTKELAEAHARAERIARQNLGSTYDMNTAARMDAAEAARLLRAAHADATIVDVVRFYLRHIGIAQSDVTVNDVIAEYLEHLTEKGKRPRTIDKALYIVRNGLGVAFGDRRIATVTTEEIEKWIGSKDVAADSKNSFRQTAHGFFAFAKPKYVINNPVSPIKKWRTEHREIEVLTAAQVQALLTAALQVAPEIVPQIALNVFAGLRPEAECARIGWDRIKDGKVFISGSVSKNNSSRRTIVMQPNLVAWLAPYMKTEGPLGPKLSAYGEQLRKAREAAGLGDYWPQDVLRHTFASMHLAAFKDPGQTAQDLGHRHSLQMLMDKYRAPIDPADAKAFWEIMPAAAPAAPA
jgi:integrase